MDFVIKFDHDQWPDVELAIVCVLRSLRDGLTEYFNTAGIPAHFIRRSGQSIDINQVIKVIPN
jgi:hypothetical protein